MLITTTTTTMINRRRPFTARVQEGCLPRRHFQFVGTGNAKPPKPLNLSYAHPYITTYIISLPRSCTLAQKSDSLFKLHGAMVFSTPVVISNRKRCLCHPESIHRDTKGQSPLSFRFAISRRYHCWGQISAGCFKLAVLRRLWIDTLKCFLLKAYVFIAI